VEFADDPETFVPYKRDEKLARMWAAPGTPGLEHRIGGLEKDALTGNVSYDPENHEVMTKTREDKVMGVRETIPTPSINGPAAGDMLVVAWGSTYGANRSAVEGLQADGRSVAHMHMRHLWPLPRGLREIFKAYKKIVIPEMNRGQLKRLLQSEYPEFDFETISKMQGKPFQARDLKARFEKILEEMS
jgi:2-oxoglutarate ferredoxin oxidoreductase subunit alpha